MHNVQQIYNIITKIPCFHRRSLQKHTCITLIKRLSISLLEFDIHSFLAWFFSIIFDRLSKNGKAYLEATTKHLNDYGETGLRTLALSYRRLEEKEYSDWNDEFQKAKAAVGADREAMLERVSDIMEKELILVGATAIEDKLQKGVRICYSF